LLLKRKINIIVLILLLSALKVQTVSADKRLRAQPVGAIPLVLFYLLMLVSWHVSLIILL